MDGSMEYGNCAICGKEGPVTRTHFYYDLKCECHSPQHFEIVRTCPDCKAIEPDVTCVKLSGLKEIWWKTEDLKDFIKYTKQQQEKFKQAFGL